MSAVAFLVAALASAAPAADTLCQQLVSHAQHMKESAWAEGDKALAPALEINEPRSTYQASGDTVTPLEASLAKLPSVTTALDTNRGERAVVVDHLAGTDIYALSAYEGTMHCQSTVFVEAGRERTPREVDGPMKFGEGDVCWTQSAAFGRAFGRPVYVMHGFNRQASADEDVQITPWIGAAWGPACRFNLRFRFDYKVTERHCFAEAVCRSADKIARAVAIAYNRQRQSGGNGDGFYFGPAPTSEARSEIQRLVEASLSPSGLPDFPGIEADLGYARPFSSTGTTLFPLTLDGRDYIAAIGHEGVGWREGSNTLFAIYSASGDKLTPLAGFVVSSSLGGLAAASVKAPVRYGNW
jgi:hypothetical protein